MRYLRTRHIDADQLLGDDDAILTTSSENAVGGDGGVVRTGWAFLRNAQ